MTIHDHAGPHIGDMCLFLTPSVKFHFIELLTQLKNKCLKMILSLYFDEKSLIAELVEFFTNLSIFEPFLWLCLSLIPVWKNKKKKKAKNQQFKKNSRRKGATQDRNTRKSAKSGGEEATGKAGPRLQGLMID